MEEPSEKSLDRHYKDQLRSYENIYKQVVCPKDQSLITKWLKTFDKAPKEQKLARNGLMLLMYGHLTEFGYLRNPLDDDKNCDKDLNELLDNYHGLIMNSETKRDEHSMERIIRHALRHSDTVNPPKIVPSPKRKEVVFSQHTHDGKFHKFGTLQPIKELPETSELEPTTSHASLQTVITKDKIENSQYVTFDSHRCYKQQEGNTLGGEKRNTFANDHKPLQPMKGETGKYSTERGTSHNQAVTRIIGRNSIDNKGSNLQHVLAHTQKEVNSSTETEISNAPKYKPKAVRSLKVCFDDMEDATNRKIISDQYLNKLKYNEAKVKEGIASLPPQFVVHQQMGNDLAERLCQLRKRNEELRQLCLKYYNRSGTLKPSHVTKMKTKRIQGFLIGAHRALKRLQRWNGLSHRLGFFATCFRYTGIGLGQWRWGAIDRSLEKATRKWFRNTLQHSQQHAWRSYRQTLLNQNAPKTADTLRLLNQIFNSRRDLIHERVSHLQQLKQLCERECPGKIYDVQLEPMLKYLDKKIHLLIEDLHKLDYQQRQLKIKSN